MPKIAYEIMPRIIVDDANIGEYREMPLVEIRRNVPVSLASKHVVSYCCFKRRDILNQCLKLDKIIVRIEE